MKYTFWGFGLIMAGLFGLFFIVMFENVTINNESEYYVLRESVEAAMYESIDMSYYIQTGGLKIIEQKFVANCTRRFYESIEGNGDSYSLAFYDIMEKPPKVSVVATSKTDNYQLEINKEATSADIQNKLSGILEFSPDGGNGWENLNNRENVQ